MVADYKSKPGIGAAVCSFLQVPFQRIDIGKLLPYNWYVTVKMEGSMLIEMEPSKTMIRERERMIAKANLPDCPVATTVQIIGNKWKLLIMRNLLQRPWRFNELQKSLDGISQKVLTDSLRAMENDGIIIRTVYTEVPPRVEYSLSEIGESMRPILDAMLVWGNNYKSKMEDL